MKMVGNTHVVAGGHEAVPQILEFLGGEGVSISGNPDLYVRQYQTFGVEEARELRARASLRGVGAERIFIIVATSMTSEAQNALLKTLEEPPANAIFFFVVPSPQMLLPTLRSRAQVLVMAQDHPQTPDAKTFLASPIAKRLDLLKVLLEKDDDDKRDIGAVIEFLSTLERALASTKNRAGGLEAIYRARKYLGDKGALAKPLLEHVALLTPVV